MDADRASASRAAVEQLQLLRQDYLQRLPVELAALEVLAGSMAANPSRTGLEDLHHGLHRLAGSGGIFGLLGLSLQARSLEVRVKALQALSPEQIAGFSWQGLLHDVALLKECMAEVSLQDQAKEPVPQQTFLTQKTNRSSQTLVWLVEDDPVQGQELARQLEAFGYRARWFTGLDEAEAAVTSERPDILLLDILYEQGRVNATEKMMDCPGLRSLGCPLVFITVLEDFDTRIRAARLGAQGYFLKPLSVPRLINRLGQILEFQQTPAERVLILDDDAVQAENYRLVLAAAGMDVQVLDDPRGLIEAVSSMQPELVLLDVNMPDYSGPDLAGLLRQYERWVGLPIVYLSAETDLERQIEALRRGGDDFITKPVSDAQLVAAVRTRVARLRAVDTQISRDGLTGLMRHSAIKEAAETEVARSRRSGKPVSVAMVDIDHFKHVNDSYGHAHGDLVISTLALLLRQHVRSSDMVGRYGGEEFSVVLPECDAEDAHRLLDGIRERFQQVSFGYQSQTFSCTFSAGVASSQRFGNDSGEGLLVAADAALYEAKRGGRNRVVVATPVVAAPAGAAVVHSD